MTHLLHVSFTRVERDQFGQPTFVLDRVGRAMLGVWQWRAMGELQSPDTYAMKVAWAAFTRRNPRAAIEAWARVRRERGEHVGDVDAAMRVFEQAKELRGDGEN